jgi:hypothetical protein
MGAFSPRVFLKSRERVFDECPECGRKPGCEKSLRSRVRLALMKASRLALVLFFAIFTGAFVACNESDLRGSWHKSKDGRAYLTVGDDNGGQCEMRVDGKPWNHPVGEAALIEPGHHKISCGWDSPGWVFEFDIPKGISYKFNYWGP